MGQKNYVKLQNQGNIVSNLRLLNEMKNSDGYADENGYFTKRDIAEIGINSLLITSAGQAGEDIVSLVHNTSIPETDNGVLQNAKQRMQLMRILGLVATDYGSEVYAITDLGKKVVEQASKEIPDYSLLREAFMGITPTSEVYDYNCDIDFNCYLGYEICYALACLDYKIGVKEMPLITTYTLDDIKEFVEVVKEYRERNEIIPDTHEHYPKKQNGDPVKSTQVTNLTRTINQILRTCGILEKKTTRFSGLNYYVCTEAGKHYVDAIKVAMERTTSARRLQFWTPQMFRKKNLLEQKQICNNGYNNMLNKGGYEVTPQDARVVFSPYQLIPESNINWLLGKEIRKPPVNREERLRDIEGQFVGSDLRLRPVFTTQEEYDEFIKNHISKSNLIAEIISAKEAGRDKGELIQELLERHKMADKETFYPFVHSLFNAMGLDCKGEIGRMDAYIEFEEHLVPGEIKSFTETPAYNMKGLRQAVENRIYSYKTDEDLEYASLVIGFNHPELKAEIRHFIEAAYNELQVKIIACDLLTLIKMCVDIVWDEKNIDFHELFTSYGIIEM